MNKMTPTKDGAGYEDLEAQLGVLSKDISELKSTLLAVAKTQRENLQHEAKAKLDDAIGRSRSAIDEASTKFEEIAESGVEAARERPLTAMAMAAGLGLLIGYLSGSKK